MTCVCDSTKFKVARSERPRGRKIIEPPRLAPKHARFSRFGVEPGEER